ncbi:hypothetical protein BCR42DRAFT_412299 [Absidia repens]|uniref:Borealin N-terminal domain-containing protein n=1 Tax=Absidia repens TaxID=90262 RepID=A0A1X2IJD7_9FUNG|nr:hypothetical protein BCR42DRAFT_412299 [Absidia repens]
MINEAISILDAEESRRIDEIRQNVDFICSSLRAQGNMTINQLLQSVRTLTMDDYCNKYRADTNYFLDEQSRKRKGTELVTPSKKRELPGANSHDSAILSKKAPKLKEIQVTSSPTTDFSKKAHFASVVKSIPANRQQQQQGQKQHTVPLTETTSDESEKEASGNPKKINDNNDDEEEVEYGPLFMQFLRPGHPKVTFQLDPQEEVNQTQGFRLQIPYEFVDQFGPGHRRRIVDQIQHIEAQLDTFKQRLLQSPASPSCPSPTL